MSFKLFWALEVLWGFSGRDADTGYINRFYGIAYEAFFIGVVTAFEKESVK